MLHFICSNYTEELSIVGILKHYRNRDRERERVRERKREREGETIHRYVRVFSLGKMLPGFPCLKSFQYVRFSFTFIKHKFIFTSMRGYLKI